MAKIKIGEKEYNLSFSMGAACNFETMTGKSALELQKFLDENEGQLLPIAQLGYCMLAASNKQEETPEYHDFVGELNTIEKIKAFREAFGQALVEFFGSDKSQDQKPTEDAAKNA